MCDKEGKSSLFKTPSLQMARFDPTFKFPFFEAFDPSSLPPASAGLLNARDVKPLPLPTTTLPGMIKGKTVPRRSSGEPQQES